MKQIIQDLKSGETILQEVPVPQVSSGHVLIKTHRSLVSLGTEKMLVEFGKANWIDKARQQPEKVRQVIDKIKTDGLRPTLDAVFRKLGEPLPLGYCNAGEVIAVGKGVTSFKIGDRVVSNGHHAEVVCVPKNLVAKIPENVTYEEAAFTVIGAIALQGIRLINPTFGETVVVTGLGLIGLIAAQLLKANGCKVVGFDFDQSKVDLAKSWGINAVSVGSGIDPVKYVESITATIGADAVLITASTKSNEVISQAARMCRKRGRIVLVGVIGLDMQRSDFYEKELTFQVSCSYGPGRYDDHYETKGLDYPIGYIRWTEQRNFEAVLHAIAQKTIQVTPLITEIVDLKEYKSIYGDMGQSKSIASILKYSGEVHIHQTSVQLKEAPFQKGTDVIGIIGAGNFTKAMIVPTLKKLNASIKSIASARGLSSTTTALKHDIPGSTTNYKDLLQDDDINAIIITTRHHQHAELVLASLAAGKHVFVEKPLALTSEEIDQISAFYQNEKEPPTLTVGFNRRFAPFSEAIKAQLGQHPSPISVIATMNAGFIPADHWTQDMEIGGGRIIGEACHYIDLITYFTGSLVEQVIMNSLGPNPQENTDNASILLRYKNGAQGVINYVSDGSKAYSKERIEVYSQGKTAIIDNFRQLKFYGFKAKSKKSAQDKGHYTQFSKFINHLKNGGPALIPLEQIINSSRAAIGAVESLKAGHWVSIPTEVAK